MHYRAHGLVSDSKFSIEFRVTLSGREIDLIFEIAKNPHVPPVRLHIPRYVVEWSAGRELAIRHPTLVQSDHEGSWITVLASSAVPLPSEIVNQFRASPLASLEAVESAIGNSIASELRQIADAASSAIIGTTMSSRPELWSETPIYWHSDTQFVARGLTDSAEILLASNIPFEYRTSLARRLSGIFSAPEKTQRILRLAHHWLLAAHSHPHGSNERFSACYQCIEALCSAAPQDSANEDLEKLDVIDSIIGECGDSGSAKLLAFTQRLRERLVTPPLKARFKRLAIELSATTADDDFISFAAASRARNDLIHGRTNKVQATIDGIDVHLKVYELGSRYLALLLGSCENSGRTVVFDAA